MWFGPHFAIVAQAASATSAWGLLLDQIYGVLAVVPGAVALTGGQDLVVIRAEPPAVLAASFRVLICLAGIMAGRDESEMNAGTGGKGRSPLQLLVLEHLSQ